MYNNKTTHPSDSPINKTYNVSRYTSTLFAVDITNTENTHLKLNIPFTVFHGMMLAWLNDLLYLLVTTRCN